MPLLRSLLPAALLLVGCSGELNLPPSDNGPGKDVPSLNEGVRDGPTPEQGLPDLRPGDKAGTPDHGASGPCGKGPTVVLGDAKAWGGYPRISVASPDRVMVVWYRNKDNNNRLRWRCFDGKSWSLTRQVTAGTGHQEYPWITHDAAGAFHLVHNDSMGDGRHVHYNRYTATGCSGAWGAAAEVLPRTPAYSAAYPSVTLDPTGIPHVTWSQSLAKRINPFPPCGSAKCTTNTHCYAGSNICIPDYSQNYSRRKSGVFGKGNWTTPEVISKGIPGAMFAHHGAIYARSAKSLHAVWLHGDPKRQIYYSRHDGTGWSKPEFTGLTAHVADVQVTTKAVYVFSNKAQLAARPLSAAVGSKWTVTNVGSGAVINFIRLQQDGSGRLHAVWNDGYRVAYAMTDAQGKWRPPRYVSPAKGQGHEPWMDVDTNGCAHIIWTDCTKPGCTGEFGAVHYRKVRYSDLP